MNYFIPTYNDCLNICDKNGNLIFYETKHIVDGYNISIFNYRLAFYNNFIDPLKDGGTINANEMRGICFVFNNDGSLYRKYLLLDKFWNINQVECSMYNNIKDLEIDNIHIKEDGSIISFIELPNGKIVSKSKASFISEQSDLANCLLNNNKKIYDFVKYTLDNDLIAIFELVSPKNRIVIKYDNDDLILLRVRDNKTGKYLDIDNFRSYDISIAKKVDKTLNELIELKETIEDIEGWVLQFKNGKLVKIKTKWYFNLHSLFTEDLNRENCLISLIINENIDDVISQLGEGSDKISEVNKLSEKINNYIYNANTNVNKLLSLYDGDISDFAKMYKKDKSFHIAIQVLRGKDSISLIKEKILRDTSKLNNAREFINKLN